jgi:hypothetical protein
VCEDTGRCAESSLPLTGERTVPDVVEENYWFLGPTPVYDLR